MRRQFARLDWMRFRWAWLVAAPVALQALALPPAVMAQDDAPIPRQYPANGFTLGSHANSPDRIATADAAALACDAGDLAGCTAWGAAFEKGAGRPQNRPVAELLYRQACDGAEAAGCVALGRLLRFADDEAIWSISADLFARACLLGSAPGCDAQADDIEAGVTGQPDPERAMTMRRANCTKFGAGSCTLLAERLTGPFRTPAQQAEGRALHERQCRAGQAADCAAAVRYARAPGGDPGPETRTFEQLSCTAGNARDCAALGTALLRGEGAGTGGDARAQAIVLFDRACTLDRWNCKTARVVREEAALDAACTAGDAAACLSLAEEYQQDRGPLPNLARAVLLRGMACEFGDPATDTGEGCARAGEAALAQAEDRAGGLPPTRIESWLTRGCTAGSPYACMTLADALMLGTVLGGDTARALALYRTQCDAQNREGCQGLQRASQTIPDAPLLLAALDEPPPEYSPEELRAMMQTEMDAQQQISEAADSRACTTNVVRFRGAEYADTLCLIIGGVINGFVARTGSAPWQALLWRPEKMGPHRLTGDQRVLCGGAVIRPGWVLTAAHCLTDEVDGITLPIRTSGHRIRLGVFNPLEDEGFSYPIMQVIPHPGYKRKGLIYDIALVQYDPRAGKRSAVVHPIAQIRLDPQPLAARPIPARMPAYTFGWGRTALEGGAPPEVLRGARLELLDSQSCTALTKWRDARAGAVLCGAGERGQQACYGDSGGPLITYGDAGKGPTVIGVVSGGIKCGTTGVASRFTRIGHREVQAWLRSHLPGVIGQR